MVKGLSYLVFQPIGITRTLQVHDPTFARIKALQAAGHNSRYVADALQLELALVNKVFGAPQYRT